MLYRVSQKTIFQNINTNLGFLTWDMSKLSNQIATEKRVNKPSDDPAGGALIMAMRSVLADVEQYNTDVALADDWLQQSESILLNMKNVVQRATELCEQLSTDTYQEENFDVAASEVEGLIENLLKMGNTRIGDRYIFAGQETSTMPFMNELTIWDAMADSGNSPAFTGQLLATEDRTYDPRPDLPEVTKTYLVEVTSTGGVDGSAMATLEIDQLGDHNGLYFEATDAYTGTAGNALQIQFVDGGAGTYSASAVAGGAGASEVGGLITISLTRNAAGDLMTTGSDIIEAIEANASASSMVDVSLLPGNSGNGTVGIMASAATLSGGVDGTAMFRVSEDGGLTWSEPDSFIATEAKGQYPLWHNEQLGHATLTTEMPGLGNDLHIIANQLGTMGNDIQVEFNDNVGPNSALSVDVVLPPAGQYQIVVNLATSGGVVTSTANDVMNAINAHPLAGEMVIASLADYREGGDGVVEAMEMTHLSGADEDVTALGHDSYTTSFSYLADEEETNPNIIFTSLEHGDPGTGNHIEIEYVSGGPPHPHALTDVSVDTVNRTITVQLETDASGEITATAKDVIDAINTFNYQNPASALVTANLVDYDAGGGQKVPIAGPFELSGGDNDLKAGDHGVLFRFQDDGSPLSLGDRFEIEVDYYRGDDEDLDVNANQGSRVALNVTGEDALGETAATDNILDTLSRLKYALESYDTTRVADELPNLDNALEKLSSQMARVGVRLARNEFTYNILESTELSATERMSRVEDLDLTEAVTELQIKQTAYQAVLAATSLVTQLSLADYIA